MKVTRALRAPAAVGVKVMLKVVDVPGVTVPTKPVVLSVKSPGFVPMTVGTPKFRSLVPGLLTVMTRAALDAATVTLPKARPFAATAPLVTTGPELVTSLTSSVGDGSRGRVGPVFRGILSSQADIRPAVKATAKIAKHRFIEIVSLIGRVERFSMSLQNIFCTSREYCT